ncbi:MAG TPA: cell division protein FtsZ [Candidatus Dependentiae bacterium]|nr:cell division protein FtsZ [Candidatus Dependentiae bacterium]
MIEFAEESIGYSKSAASIKIIGVGGAGGNTVNSIIDTGCQGIECIVVNTDAQALELSKAPFKVQIGVKLTKGLGTGANPEIGKRAAEEDIDKVMEVIGNADIVFLAGGMGGGTGSGALPVIAQALREKGILSVAIITKPFSFEGKRREFVAEKAIDNLKQIVDTLIIIPNQKLLEITEQNISMIDAFALINDLLGQSVRGIFDIIAKPGHINVDYADVRAIMKDTGLAVMGTGKASGQTRAKDAAQQAISSPLLENMNVIGAHGVLLNITGGNNLGLHEISEAASVIYEQAHEDANIIIGSVIDENLSDEVIVTIIATGFAKQDQPNNSCAIEEPLQVRATVLDRSEQPMKNKETNQDNTTTDTAEETEKILTTQKTTNEKHEQELSADNNIDENNVNASKKNNIIIDPNDLDVPTFLRKDAEQDNLITE